MVSARALVFALGGVLAVLNPAAAQGKPVEPRFSIWVPPTHANVVSAKEWGESITKLLPDRSRSRSSPLIFYGVAPFIVADILRLIVLMIFHAIATFLPGRMG